MRTNTRHIQNITRENCRDRVESINKIFDGRLGVLAGCGILYILGKNVEYLYIGSISAISAGVFETYKSLRLNKDNLWN